MSNQKIEKKSVLDLIDDALEILKNSKSFFEIIIKGEKTNVIISKPASQEKEEKDESE